MPESKIQAPNLIVSVIGMKVIYALKAIKTSNCHHANIQFQKTPLISKSNIYNSFIKKKIRVITFSNIQIHKLNMQKKHNNELELMNEQENINNHPKLGEIERRK